MTGVIYAAAGTARPAKNADRTQCLANRLDAGSLLHAELVEVAREFSPRIDVCGPREIALDLNGLTRLFGDARAIADELRRTAADRGLQVRIAIAGTRTAARLLVRHRAGVTIVEQGGDVAALAPLPLHLLADIRGRGSLDPPRGTASSSGRGAVSGKPADAGSLDPLHGTDADLVITLRRWGLRTLGDLTALPPDDVVARLGQVGVSWQRLARGEDPAPLVPSVPEERFEQALDLEWPIEGLEPLSFVLGRLMEPLSAHLERRDRGAAVLHVRLHLVSKAMHERSLQLPAPMRDPRTLRTLALLDLESHPPAAAIDRVVVAVDPTPARVLQYSLITRPLPSPEQVSTLMARLNALMGEGRCGSPAVVDSWRPGAFDMAPFAPGEAPSGGGEGREGREGKTLAEPGDSQQQVVVALRRFRFAVPARVQVEDGRPVRVTTDRHGLGGGRIERAAGPWRTSGEWWAKAETGSTGETGETDRSSSDASWDRDEWDVTVADGATYRLFRERDANAWFVDGVLD
jgi:protein ImuB